VLIEFKKQKNWIVFTIAATILSFVSYHFYEQASLKNGGTGPSGSTIPGLLYGTVGFLMMVFCGLLGARRAVRVWKLGRAKVWLNAHIWLGLLAFPLIVCHSAFHMGHKLTLWLMLLFIVVELTGILGVILQQYIPKIMLQAVKNESTYEQIPEVIGKLKIDAAIITSCCAGKVTGNLTATQQDDVERKKAEKLKKDADFKDKYTPIIGTSPEDFKAAQPLMTFFNEQVEPFLDPVFQKDAKLAELRKATAVFNHIKTLLPQKLHVALEELQSLCDERRQLQVQVRLHRILHFWEYFHIPLSYLLLALSAFHVFIATFDYSGATKFFK